MPEVIKVFIGSPGDIKEERKYAKQAVEELSQRLMELIDVVLVPVNWERFAPSATPGPGIPVQEPINARVGKSHIFIGILFTRWGTKIAPGRKESGTEAEFKEALANREHIEILTYFRDPATARIPTDPGQLRKLKRLRTRLNQEGLFHQTYCEPDEFKERIGYDLTSAVLKILQDIHRRTALQSFFLHGIRKHQQEPSFMIGYPALDKHCPGSEGAASDWCRRLVPNVVYEDFKAISKIEAALRHSGVADVRSVTTDLEKLGEPGNRVWLCLPRNERAQQELRSLGKAARFEFGEEPDTTRFMSWRPAGGGKPFKIYSPLGSYLSEQRPDGEREWDPRYGRVFAKDYAVVARFPVKHDQFNNRRGGAFYHYYVAGIRGLGTWGAGWFIQRRYDLLEQAAAAAKGGPITLLLEVTFKDYHIHEVVDVSDRKSSHFQRENKLGTIRDNIRHSGCGPGRRTP